MCFKWCLVRYLNLVDHYLERTTKTDKDCARELDFKDIKFAVKSSKIEKKNSIVISVSGYENKVKYPILNNNKYQKEKTTSIYF